MGNKKSKEVFLIDAIINSNILSNSFKPNFDNQSKTV
jgi:hypothetical protein